MQGRPTHSFQDLPDRSIRILPFSETKLISAIQGNNGSNFVRIWDIKTENMIDSLPIQGRIFGLYRLSDQKFVVHTEDHGMTIIDIETKERLSPIQHAIFKKPLSTTYSFDAETAVFANTGLDSKLLHVVWLRTDQTMVEKVFDHGENVIKVGFASDRILITRGTKRVILWDLLDGRKIKVFEVNRLRYVSDLTILGQDRWIVAKKGPNDVRYEYFDLWQPQCDRASRRIFEYFRSFFRLSTCSYL